jgi:hypothetical protein
MIFSFLSIFHVLQWTFLSFPPFSVFLAIFHVLKCVFLIFRDFQFSRHIPGPSVGISHFSRFLVISSFFKSSSGCFSFSKIFSFLAIFHVLQRTFQNYPTFSVFLALFHILKCVFLIFPRCSVFSPYSRSYSVHYTFFTFCSDFVIFQVVKWMFLIFHDFQFSCHIPCPTADSPKFSTFFSFPRHISSPKVCISHIL